MMIPKVCPSCQTHFDSAREGIARVRGTRVVTFCSQACADVAPHSEVPATALDGAEPSAPEIIIIAPEDGGHNDIERSEPEPLPPVTAVVIDEGVGATSSDAAATETDSDEARGDVAPGVDDDVDDGAAPDIDDDADDSAAAEADDGAAAEADADGADDTDERDEAGLALAHLVDYQAERSSRSSRRSKIIALSAAMLVGGMVITIVSAVSPSSPSAVQAERSQEQASLGNPAMAAVASQMATANAAATGAVSGGAEDEPAPGSALVAPEPATDMEPEAAPLSLADMYTEAEDTLEHYLESPSVRLQRIAATALARTGHARAIARLRQLLDKERVDLRKIEIAYALARTGDKPAQKLLRRRLGHKRRDVRVDAARSLVALGDDSGASVLERMLSVRSHRLGAAGLLARLKVPRGIRVLQKTLADRKTSAENKMRATVALGLAGDESVRTQLLELLADRRYQVGAAEALATLSDEAAVEALKQQLALPSLRVQAALGLRRMGAQADLEVLAAALDNGSDPARVSAAEAILILAGPESIAEFD